MVVYLWDDKQYIRTIIEGIDQNVSNVKLTSHLICCQNDDSISDLADEFLEYGARFYCLEVSEFIEGVNSTIQNPWKSKRGTMHVPSRVSDGNDAYLDISGKYLTFCDRNVEVVYQGIANEAAVSDQDYSFFKGNTISWKELEVDTEVRRNKLNELTAKVTKWLETSKGGYSIELHHKPGAGGTTLARRLAFDLHTKYPTVLITKYRKGGTNVALFDLAELTRKPILAIVEAHNITQNELNALIRKINEDKKHVVVIYVRRVFRNSPNEKDSIGKIVYLDDRAADLTERDRFVARYSQIALPQSKPLVKKMSEQNPHQCEIIDFALTAYEEEFSTESLRNYIHNYLSKLSASHLKFVGIASMIYYYTQKECSELWFQSLFNNETLSDQLTQRPYEERFIKRLFIQQIGDNYEFTGFWRPRFSRFASEILTLTLVGLRTNTEKDDWKDFLSRWTVELIRECRASNEYLTEETRAMLKSLLLDRDNEDVLGKNDLVATSVTDERKFSQLIRHISNRDEQLEVFRTLVECYPYETHFLGHLGRFLYETATDSHDYENAESEISKALELGEGDFNLWHIKGMCNRRRIEFLVRSNTSEYSEDELIDLEEIVQELAETANEDFARSRELNTHNLHSHAAQIQMLLSVINFGRQIANTESKEQFISDKKNIWYGNQLDKVLELIDEAQYIIELSKDLDQSKVIKKSKDMIEGCEGNVFNLLGDFSKAINRFKSLADSAERSSRPYFRKMFVYATLAGKNKPGTRNLRSAWNKLSIHEYTELKRALESNIREQPDNPHHFKLWLQAVRYSDSYISLDDCISTVKVWYDNSLAYQIAHLEAAYYMYVLNACKAISSGDTWGEFNVVEARKYKEECREKRMNDKFSFEWYGAGDGVKRLVHHSILGRMNSDKRFFEDPSLLAHVEGIITNIYDKQKGRIKLKCGIEAFFVPANGGFDVEDETSLVRFYVAFRQDGLVAWEVQKVKNLEPVVAAASPEIDIEGFDQDDEKEEPKNALEEEQNEITREGTQKTERVPFDETKLKGLTIVGKIDLSQWERFKKRKGG